MNYLIWNNKDSRKVNGLIISELPMIVKPKMRTEIIEVEGRGGNFIDNLGYSAYDKTVKIALYDNYDIDEIIKYFSGSGKVIFSNEPQKYYNAEIIEQIDFERLVKFKIANVKFNTQPYKYLVSESETEYEITEGTNQIAVINQGLENSRPIITLTGSEIVEIKLNSMSAFQVDIDIVKPTKAIVHKEGNRDYYMDLKDSIDYLEYYQSGNIIRAPTPWGEQGFRITNVSVKNKSIHIKAYHLFYDAENYIISDSYVAQKNCNDALEHLNMATDSPSPFITISDVSSVRSYRCVRKNLAEAIQEVLNRWGGHLVRDNWNIEIRTDIGGASKM